MRGTAARSSLTSCLLYRQRAKAAPYNSVLQSTRSKRGDRRKFGGVARHVIAPGVQVKSKSAAALSPTRFPYYRACLRSPRKKEAGTVSRPGRLKASLVVERDYHAVERLRAFVGRFTTVRSEREALSFPRVHTRG